MTSAFSTGVGANPHLGPHATPHPTRNRSTRQSQNASRLGRIKEKQMLWRGFQKPKRLAVDTETLSDKYGKFSAQPFERGFGTTIGNALRRTLLSSIEGAPFPAAPIEAVLHEFQPI